MGSSADGKFTRWVVQGLGFTRWGLKHIGWSGVKLQGSNPGSLLRSKSTRHERRCEAVTEWLVILIGECPTPPYLKIKKNQSCSELSETNFGIGFASIRENFFSILEIFQEKITLKIFKTFLSMQYYCRLSIFYV